MIYIKCYWLNYKIDIKTINNNLTKLGIENYRVYLKDFRVFLRETTDKYNLIFIDLSYKTDFINIFFSLLSVFDDTNNQSLMSEKDFSVWWLTNIINNTIIKS